MIRDAVRLRRLLGGADWAWWRGRARSALAAGRGLPTLSTLVQPTPGQRQAANELFGTPGAIGPVRVRSAAMAGVLTDSGIADDLVECLVELDGPLPEPDLDGPRWTALLAAARSALAGRAPEPRLAQLLDQGGLRRLAAGDPNLAERLLADTGRVLDRLGTPRQLAALAVAATGDAHALDRDQPLGRLIVRLLGGDEDARAWRATWAAAGIRSDELSPTALGLGLRFAGDGGLARIAAIAAETGEPLRLTSRQLRDPTPLLLPGGRLHVCENPAVVAYAAERLGPACAPLLASEGWPSVAVLDLLDRARAAGATILVHADFDWAGLAIAGELITRYAANPWHFDAEALSQHVDRPGPPLCGDPVETPWDPTCATALSERGRALHEEAVLDDLIGGLAPGLDETGVLPRR